MSSYDEKSDRKETKEQREKSESFLSPEERGQIKRYLKRPEDFPKEFGAWIIDFLNVNGLDIPVTQLRGFNRYITNRGTTFPTEPEDTQPFILDVDPDNGIAWSLRYDSRIGDSYKWVYEGGSPMYVSTAAAESTTSTGFHDLSTVATITLPKAGIYRFDFGASMDNSTADSDLILSVKYSNSEATDADGIQAEGVVTGGGANRIGMSRALIATVPTDSQDCKLRYRVGSGTGTYRNRWLLITPVRIAGS